MIKKIWLKQKKKKKKEGTHVIGSLHLFTILPPCGKKSGEMY